MNLLGKAVNAVSFWGGAALGAIFRADYLAKAHKGARVSEKSLDRILRCSRNTEYGKRYGFSSIKSVEDYQKAVPLSTYDNYQDYIDRMVNKGEQKLITGHRISYYAASSGSVGQTKLIPQATACYWSIFKVICLMVRDAAAAMQQRSACGLPARGLLTTEIHISRVDDGEEGAKASGGTVSSYAINGVKVFLPLFTPFPREAFEGGIEDLRYVKARYALQDPEVRWLTSPFMSALTDIVTYIIGNHEMLIRDIENGTIDPAIAMSAKARKRLERKLRPDPKRAAVLKAAFDGDSDAGVLSRVWNKLSLVSSVGAGDFTPFTNKMKRWCGKDVRFGFSCYTASEAWMGYAFRFNDPSYLLLLDGIFYEFLPVGEDGEADTEHPLLVHQLELGKYYEIVLTTPAGLYRYRLRDVLKVTGFEGQVPYLEFAYRANRALELSGTHINDELIAAGVQAVTDKLGIGIEEFSAYGEIEQEPPRIVMFMEPERPVTDEERQQMINAFEERIFTASYCYRIDRQPGDVAPPELYTVAPGTYSRHRRMKIESGKPENQIKAVRSIRNEEDYAFFRAAADGHAQAWNKDW